MQDAVASSQHLLDAAVNALIAWADQATSGASTGSGSTGPASGTPSPASSGGTHSTTSTGGTRASATTGGASSHTSGSSATSGQQTSGATGSAAGSATTAGSGSAKSSGSAGGSGGAQTTVEQAEVAVQEAQLARTNAALAREQATLVAPATGTLTEFPFVVGQAATTSQAATVRTTDNKAITLDVSQTNLALVKPGQQVAVTSGTGAAFVGTVGSVSLLPTSSTSATWPVSINVSAPDGLASGTTANAVITVASAADAVLVPLSAVTLTGTNAGTVTVVSGGTTKVAQVKLGIVGPTRVQVTEGISAGQTVMLSDPSAALPSTTSSTRIRTGSGGFGATSGGFGGQAPVGAPPR